MRRRFTAMIVFAIALTCAGGCLPTVTAKPSKTKPVSVAKPKPKPTKSSSAPSAKPSAPAATPTFPAAAPGDWTGWRANDGATGDNPYETSITSANVATLHEAWTAPSGRSPTLATPPLVAGGLVYDTQVGGGVEAYSYETTLAAFDLHSGAVRWQRSLADWQQVVGVAAGLVLVVNPDFAQGSIVQAFDQKTGTPRWTWRAPDIGQINGTAMYESGHIVVPIGDDLYALDPANGRQAFAIRCTDADGVNCPFNLINGSAAAGNVIFVGGFENSAGFAFSASDGRRLNGVGVPYSRGDFRFPLVAGHQAFLSGVYMGSDGHQVGEVASFSTTPCGATVCTPQWSVQLPGGAGQLALADGRLFVVGGGDGNLEALNSATGQILWQTKVAPDEPGLLTVAGNVLYVAEGHTILAFPASGCAGDRDCQPLWRYDTPDKTQDLHYPVVVTGGRLLYADWAGLHALAVT